MRVLPILMYHHVSPRKGDMVTITPGSFEAQLRHITARGYGTLTLDEAVAFVRGEYSPKGRCVALTFDDGYLDNYVHAFPLLEKYGVKASIFLVTGWVDGASGAGAKEREEAVREWREAPPSHDGAKMLASAGELHRVSITWDMARAMRSTGLVEFYSHTVTHSRCDRLGPGELAGELGRSKEALERELGGERPYLCWPRGKYNGAAVEAARSAGYRAVFTTAPGVARPGDDPMELKRIVVKEGRGWLAGKLRIYTNPVLADLYLRLKGRL